MLPGQFADMTQKETDYVPACFPISNYELRPAQVTGNCKYLHGNNPTFHRSRLSWVRSHNETMNNALHTPFAAITEIWFCHSAWLLTNMWGLCRFSRVRSVSSWPFCEHLKHFPQIENSQGQPGRVVLPQVNTSCCLQGVTGGCWEQERWYFKLFSRLV